MMNFFFSEIEILEFKNFLFTLRKMKTKTFYVLLCSILSYRSSDVNIRINSTILYILLQSEKDKLKNT